MECYICFLVLEAQSTDAMLDLYMWYKIAGARDTMWLSYRS